MGRIPDIQPWCQTGYRISGLGARQDTGYPALVLGRIPDIQLGAGQDTGYLALVQGRILAFCLVPDRIPDIQLGARQDTGYQELVR